MRTLARTFEKGRARPALELAHGTPHPLEVALCLRAPLCFSFRARRRNRPPREHLTDPVARPYRVGKASSEQATVERAQARATLPCVPTLAKASAAIALMKILIETAGRDRAATLEGPARNI